LWRGAGLMGRMVALFQFLRQSRRALGSLSVFLVVLAATTSGCQTTGGRAMGPENMVPTVLSLAPGDVLDITFASATNMNAIRRVGPEGSISMPMIGQVQVAGKTVVQVEADLKERFAKELQDPELFVNLAQSGNVVYVSGSVARPGRIVLERPLTALEAILEAGGFAPDANLEKVKVIRYEGNDNTTFEINLEPVYSGGPVPPFYVMPRDVVNVPRKVQWF
jgi:polysaccharide export outer membrane protein